MNPDMNNDLGQNLQGQPQAPQQPSNLQFSHPSDAGPSQSQPTATTPSTASPNPVGIHELFDQMAEKIIEQQEAIIGPIAVEQAKRVKELKINWPEHDVDIEGSPQSAINQLVEQYKELFGQIAVETCKEAAALYVAQIPGAEVPESLK